MTNVSTVVPRPARSGTCFEKPGRCNDSPLGHGESSLPLRIMDTPCYEDPTVDNLPNLELLESTHSFPGTYVFKVIGEADGNFIGRVVAAVRSELAESIEPSFSFRKTAGRRHVCVTIEPPVDNGSQVLAIYRRLQDVDGLIMLL